MMAELLFLLCTVDGCQREPEAKRMPMDQCVRERDQWNDYFQMQRRINGYGSEGQLQAKCREVRDATPNT